MSGTGEAGIIGTAPVVTIGRAPDYEELIAKEKAAKEQAALAGVITSPETCDDPTGTCSVNPMVMPHSHAKDFHDSPVQPSGVVLPPVYPRPPEVDIYTRMWDMPEYRQVSPGERIAQTFLEQAKPRSGSKVLDLGCGTGRGGFMLAVLGNMDVTFVDFTNNSLDEDVRNCLVSQSHVMHFVQADLTKEIPVTAEYGFCTDVMEHIPPQDVDKVLDNILRSCQHVFFQIATTDDVMGELIGHPLHLTVQPFEWWLAKFNERQCTVLWTFNREGQDGHHLGHCLFYVTAWATGKNVLDYGVLNTTDQQIMDQVKSNIWYGCEGVNAETKLPITSPLCWKQVTPHQTNDEEVMIVGGSPSIAEFVEEIRHKRDVEGIKLVTLNGAFNWCLAHDIVPSATVVVDAREFNSRFTHPQDFTLSDANKLLYDKVKYLIASQVHPSTLAGLPQERTYLWHTTTEMIRELLSERYASWYGIPGGSTVLLRAIPLLRVLGFHKFHLYGCDSCVATIDTPEGKQQLHHAYTQTENADEKMMPVNVNAEGVAGGKTYLCHGWMVAQAQGFIDLIKFMGHEIDLEVFGDGLLAHILKYGAAEFDRSVFL